MDFFAEATSAVVDASSTIIVTTQPTDIHSMPNEVLVKILQYVVVTENNIVVTQVCDRSNKFLHGKYKTVDDTTTSIRRYVSTDSKLDFSAALLVCRDFYNLLNETAMFYRLNNFEFVEPLHLQSYLSSITPARMKDLQTVIIHWFGYLQDYGHGFLLLAACNSLQNLTIITPISLGYPVSDLIKALENVRCKHLKLLFQPIPGEYLSSGTESRRVQLEKTLQSITSRPRVKIQESKIVNARMRSKVTIHGNSRLSGDLNPFPSSRTRGALARTARLNENGVVEETKLPKFNSMGDLLWDIKYSLGYSYSIGIIDHRETTDSVTLEKSVQLHVRWRTQLRMGPGSDQAESWEPLEVLLSNPKTHGEIVRYYSMRSCWGQLDGAVKILEAILLDRLNSQDDLEKPRARKTGAVSLVTRARIGVRAHHRYLAKKIKEDAKAEAEAIKEAAKKVGKSGGKAGQKRKRGE